MTLAELAERIMFLYFGDYPSDENVLDIEDFKTQVSIAYAKLLSDEYREQKQINKQDDGFSMVTLSPDLLCTEEVDVLKDGGRLIAKLGKAVFVFPFDSMAAAVQSVVASGDSGCGEFIKMSINDRWKVCMIPSTDKSYYTVEKDKIVIEKLSCKNISKIKVMYAPGFDSTCADFVIPDVRAAQIQTMVLQILFAAKQGMVVDMSNNSNPNNLIQTETDKNLFKQ